MYKVLDKDMIEIVAFILRTSRDFPDGPFARDRERHPLQTQDGCVMGPIAHKGTVQRYNIELAVGIPPLPQVVQVRVLD